MLSLERCQLPTQPFSYGILCQDLVFFSYIRNYAFIMFMRTETIGIEP